MCGGVACSHLFFCGQQCWSHKSLSFFPPAVEWVGVEESELSTGQWPHRGVTGMYQTVSAFIRATTDLILQMAVFPQPALLLRLQSTLFWPVEFSASVKQPLLSAWQNTVGISGFLVTHQTEKLILPWSRPAWFLWLVWALTIWCKLESFLGILSPINLLLIDTKNCFWTSLQPWKLLECSTKKRLSYAGSCCIMRCKAYCLCSSSPCSISSEEKGLKFPHL